MQVHQPTQDLPGPALEHLSINVLVALAVPTESALLTAVLQYITCCNTVHSRLVCHDILCDIGAGSGAA